MSLTDIINTISALGSLVTILVAAITAIYFLRTRNPDMKEIVRICVIAFVICAVVITGGIYGLHAAFPPVTLNPTATIPPQPSFNPTQFTADPFTPVAVQNPYASKDTAAENMRAIALNDPLNGSNGTDYQWESDGSATPISAGQGSSFCGFETDSSYHALSKDPTSNTDFTFCPAQQTNFASLTFEVQMDITCCNSGNYGGIFFREQNSQNMYLWTISENTYSTIYIDRSGTFTPLLSGGYIKSFNGGNNQTNTLGVVVNGGQIDFFVNGYYITTAHNQDIASGAIGVVGGNNSDVVFSNAKVWTA